MSWGKSEEMSPARTPVAAASTTGTSGEANAGVALSIIIVAWNVRALVLQCIAAIQDNGGGLPLEIILVDNGSGDGTVEAVRAACPQVLVIANQENLGFPRPNNQGLERARGKYVLFLNSDTLVGEGTLQACVAELERDAAVGMVTSRLVYPEGGVQYEAGRHRYLLQHLLWETFYLHMLFPRSRVFAQHLMGDWDHLGSRDVDAVSGAFMMVRRELAQRVGGLPEDLFMYHEDLSFCLRVRRLGYRIRYLGEVETVHLAGRTTRKNQLRWYLLEGEVKTRLIREAQGPAAAVLARALFGVRELVRLPVSMVGALIPGFGRVRERFPALFHVERHLLLLAWSMSPRLVRPLLPAPARRPLPPSRADVAV
jgi:GT2 family glycosyltransferase